MRSDALALRLRRVAGAAGYAPCVIGLALCACLHTHLDRNAPGDVRVLEPPKDIGKRALEKPDDPGERMIVASVGPLTAVGFTVANPGPTSVYTTGFEGSVHYGERETSHLEDDFFAFPKESQGINVGWLPWRSRGRGAFAGYLEAQYAKDALGIAAGFASDGPGLYGGQATVFFGPIFARVRVFPSSGVDVMAGLFFKLPYVWVWSR